MVVDIKVNAEPNLVQIVDALSHHSASLGLPQRRQKHPGKDPNDRDHHQQLDQCESTRIHPAGSHPPSSINSIILHGIPEFQSNSITLFTIVNTDPLRMGHPSRIVSLLASKRGCAKHGEINQSPDLSENPNDLERSAKELDVSLVFSPLIWLENSLHFQNPSR
jgi:hypothetical protein